MVEKGTMPASSQGLPTSGILKDTSRHLEHLIFTESIHGRCGEFPSNLSQPSTALLLNSSLLPITSKLPHFAHSQTGRASPQWLFWKKSKSCLFFNKSSLVFSQKPLLGSGSA